MPQKRKRRTLMDILANRPMPPAPIVPASVVREDEYASPPMDPSSVVREGEYVSPPRDPSSVVREGEYARKKRR